MKRFFVENTNAPLKLTGENHKHLSVVLRAKTGDEVILCTGDGYDCFCKIEEIRKNETLLEFICREKNISEPDIDVTLFMSVMKGDKNEFVVQKATELGVKEIYPVITRYVQGHERNIKIERLNKIALEAARQCGRSVLTKVYSAVDFSVAAQILDKFDLVVFPYEKAEAPSLKSYLRGKFDKVKSVAVFVGSEGGFHGDEVEVLQGLGVVPVTLGKRVLRAETANVAVLSAIMYEAGQWE